MNIVIKLNGNQVEEIITDKKANVLVLNCNIKDANNVKHILGADCAVNETLIESTVDFGNVFQAFKEAKRSVLHENLEFQYVREMLEDYLEMQGLDLSDEQKSLVIHNVKSQLNDVLDEILKETVASFY